MWQQKDDCNQEGKKYTEIFKEWLEDNDHTSILELIKWEDQRSKIKATYWDLIYPSKNSEDEYGPNMQLYSWKLIWNKEKIKKEDKYEKELETNALLYQWFSENIASSRLNEYEEERKRIEEKLINYRYWKKKKKQALTLGIISIILVTTFYLMRSKPKPKTTWNYE